MKKAKNKRIFAVCIFAVILFVLSGCGKSENPVMNIAIKDGRQIYNGTEQRFYQVEEGTAGELRIKVDRESGTLDISVVSSDNSQQSFYRGKDIPTSDFTVDLTAPGEYKVLIEAKDFAGDYSFVWGTRQVKQ
ncbi:MAG: hypothetical protein ACI4JG_05520 [Acutalibacteraceae bacterium]